MAPKPCHCGCRITSLNRCGKARAHFGQGHTGIWPLAKLAQSNPQLQQGFSRKFTRLIGRKRIQIGPRRAWFIPRQRQRRAAFEMHFGQQRAAGIGLHEIGKACRCARKIARLLQGHGAIKIAFLANGKFYPAAARATACTRAAIT